MAPTRASRGDGEKGIRGDMGPQTEPLGPVRVCWGGGARKRGEKAAREASVIGCCSFSARGEIILNTDTQ